MNTKTISSLPSDILSTSSSPSSINGFTRFDGFWDALVKALFVDERELQVVKKRDRSGQIRWKIFDPTTNQVVYVSSEAEARIWVEQRHYVRQSIFTG